ncbi:MAG: hypothetical protein HZB99_00100 [Candidatus Harrisonbacteria bacterium]|nr:hypothetical protein [Candidatus Harrisonbacteria bacterium]
MTSIDYKMIQANFQNILNPLCLFKYPKLCSVRQLRTQPELGLRVREVRLGRRRSRLSPEQADSGAVRNIISGISQLIISKIYLTIKAMETPGFGKESAPRQKSREEVRSQERKTLRHLLPPDLQLKFEPKGRWNFEGELLRRRHSEIKEDQTFFDFLKMKKEAKERTGMPPEGGDAFVLEFSKARHKVSSELALIDTLYSIEIEILQNDDLSAAEIGKILADKDPQFAREIMNLLINKGGIYELYEGTELALKLGERQLAEKNLQTFLDQKQYSYAGKIALGLGNLELAKQSLENLYKKESRTTKKESEVRKKFGLTIFSADMAELGRRIAEQDPEFGRNFLEKLLSKKRVFEAAKVAIGLGDPELAERLRSELYNGGIPELSMEIGLDMAKLDFDFGWKWMERNLAHGDPILPPIAVGKIVAVLAERQNLTGEQTSKIKEIRDKLLKAGGHESLFVAGKIALASGDVSAYRLAQKDLQESKSEPARLKSNKLVIEYLKRKEISPETKRLIGVLSDVTKEKRYAVDMVKNLLLGGDLLDFQSKYLPTFLALKDYGMIINNKAEEGKKWENPELFFEINTDIIVNLQLLDNNLSAALLRSWMSRGFSFADSNLVGCVPVLEDIDSFNAVQKFIKSQKGNLSYYEFGKLLEIASGYIASGRKEIFVSLLGKASPYKETLDILNGKLFEIIARKAGVKGEIAFSSAEHWPLRFLPNLVNHYQFLKTESKVTQDLYGGVLRAAFENRFSKFISDEGQTDKLGKKIALHNQEVEKTFKKSGINWENWENFSGQEAFEVGAGKKISPEESWGELMQKLTDLQELLGNLPVAGSLRKDMIRIQKEKGKFDFSGIDLSDPEWQKKNFPNYARGLEYLISKNPGFVLPGQAAELWKQIQEFVGVVQRRGKDQHAKKRFLVKKWDRDPRRDLFQGNYSRCCISIGEKGIAPQQLPGVEFDVYPPGILEFLVDKGVQVAEVIDEEIGEPIGQCWLYVSLDKNNQPVLVADTFDIQASYGIGKNENRGIREAMFKFLRNYADAAGIKNVVLGKKWGNGDSIVNKVEVGDLPKTSLPPIKKLGGYVNKKQYYLETTGSREVYLIE